MRILLTLILVLSCHLGFSQKALTLIIDTIDFIDDFDKYNFNIFLTNQGFLEMGEIDTAGVITTKSYPNFQTTIQLMSDSTKIQIPIDQKNGFLELSNLYDQDTIIINYIRHTKTR